MTETQITLLGFIVSFIGGGSVGVILNWIRSNRAESRERKSKYLEEQINKLYGPLYYLVSQSKKLFEIERRLKDAYTKEFIDQKYSDDKLTQERLNEDAHKTIALQNQYIDLVVENNHKIKETLDSNIALVDMDDIDIIINYFYEHLTRFQIETKTKTPYMIYEHLGDISFLRPEFIKRIEEKFQLKKSIYEEISKKR